MKCTKCGAETERDVKFCTQCGAPMETPTPQEPAGDTAKQAVSNESQETGWVNPEGEEIPRPQDQESGPPEPAFQTAETAPDAPMPAEEPAEGAPAAAPAPNKKFTRILTIVIAILAAVSVGALAFVKLTAKDPKQVVIEAFENIWPQDQTLPSEELFGLKALAESSLTADSETGLTLKLDSCSVPYADQFAGSGLRFAGKNDITNGKSSANAGVIYNGMDLLNLDVYYGDETLMAAVPELSGRVFTLDLSDGLGERIANSPYFGPLMESSGVDMEGFASYFSQLIDEAEQAREEGKAPFDLEALMNRYKEGSKAQENFKAALAVEKAENNGTYTMNGKEVSCKGYYVTVSKDSMIEFLETSTDFFLQDETLKQDFLRQMESTVKMTELMGGGMYGEEMLSAQEMQEQSYDEAKKAVDSMIRYLDASLSDIQMTVYVDKKGNLAAVEGSTQMYPEELAEEDQKYVDITFSWELQGGAYLTQNFEGNITVEHDGRKAYLDILRQGVYDGKKLTDDISVDLNAAGETYNFVYTSTYDSDGGSYHTSVELGGEGTQIVKASISGVLDQLEKGKSFHMDIDALEISAINNSVNVVLSGEYYYQPLEGEVTAPEGEALDILEASESDWNSVGMEIMMNGFSVMSQLGVNMY